MNNRTIWVDRHDADELRALMREAQVRGAEFFAEGPVRDAWVAAVREQGGTMAVAVKLAVIALRAQCG